MGVSKPRKQSIVVVEGSVFLVLQGAKVLYDTSKFEQPRNMGPSLASAPSPRISDVLCYPPKTSSLESNPVTYYGYVYEDSCPLLTSRACKLDLLHPTASEL